MLNTANILNLIRLTELEIRRLQADIDGDDEIKRDEAGEIIVQFDDMAQKLKEMYIKSNPDYDVYPEYENYIRSVKE